MIGSLRGQLLERTSEAELLIEVGGLGYRVQVTPSVSASLGAVGGEVFVHTHHAVREDSDTLYGFSTIDERRVFESLISAHGVGPALGLAIMSVHGPTALRTAVAQDDLAALCLVPGVGRKTAARLVIELKSKLGVPAADSVGVPGRAPLSLTVLPVGMPLICSRFMADSPGPRRRPSLQSSGRGTEKRRVTSLTPGPWVRSW